MSAAIKTVLHGVECVMLFTTSVNGDRMAEDALRTIVQPHREGGGSSSLPHFILPQQFLIGFQPRNLF